MLDLIGIHSKNTIFRLESLGSCGMEEAATNDHKKANASRRTTEDS